MEKCGEKNDFKHKLRVLMHNITIQMDRIRRGQNTKKLEIIKMFGEFYGILSRHVLMFELKKYALTKKGGVCYQWTSKSSLITCPHGHTISSPETYNASNVSKVLLEDKNNTAVSEMANKPWYRN